MSQAAELLGVQAAFLRSLDSSGVLRAAPLPRRPPPLLPRTSSPSPPACAACSTTATPLASAETIVGLQDELASARADADRLRADVDRAPTSPARDRPGDRARNPRGV